MKKTFKTKFILFTFILLMLFSPFCLASDIAPTASNTSVELTNDTNAELSYEFIPSDVYKFDNDVVIDSIVDGNAFAFGDNITISGEIGGDVFAFGNNITFTDTSYIHGSIFVFAKTVTINGICYDVYGVAQKFTLDNDAIVARDFRVTADNLYINGQIKRDAHLVINQLVFPDNASGLISGNLNYIAESEFDIPTGIVGGSVNYTHDTSGEVSVANKITSYINDILSSLLYSLVVVLLAIWLAPDFKDKATKILQKRAPLSFGVGLLAAIVVVIAAVAFLFITGGLGFGVSIAVVAIFVLALTIAKTVFSMACAKLISTKFKSENKITFVLITLLVVLIVSLLEIIPYIGSFIGFIVNMFGLGIIVLNLISKKNLDDKTEENIVTE